MARRGGRVRGSLLGRAQAGTPDRERRAVAETNGLWRRGLGASKPALDTAWKPYLDGQGTRDEALAALLRQPTPPGR